jgi:putative salt-induced outer membrane protein
MRTSTSVLSAVTVLLTARGAHADDAPSTAPPPEATALVSAPKASAEAPKVETPTDSTSVTLSAGGQWVTGNSQQLAGTVNGVFQMRRGSDGFGATLLGNYAEGHPQNQEEHVTTQNVQGRLRYDRYLIEQLSLFLIATGRNDRFQGIDFRLNLDPGVKYLFVNSGPTQYWGELGYDFQYDIRRDDARLVKGTGGQPDTLLAKTVDTHAGRAFLGFKHAFNKEVTLSTGIEYIQSFEHSTDYWVNYEAIFASNLGGGFSLGLGFTARFEHDPLPGKKQWDTATTASLIYAFSGPPPKPAPPPPPPPCVPPPPPPIITPVSAPPATTSPTPP